jgi:hypothetical protein
MADATYQPKVYREQGGDKLVVKSGGEIKVETGGKVTSDGTQAAAIVTLTDSTTGTAGDTVDDSTASVKDDIASLAKKINDILAALRGAGIIVT